MIILSCLRSVVNLLRGGSLLEKLLEVIFHDHVVYLLKLREDNVYKEYLMLELSMHFELNKVAVSHFIIWP